MTTPGYADIVDRLEPRMQRDPSTGCCNWTGELTTKGYARLRVNGNYYTVHRVLYELHVGPIPDGLQLDHLCRNRRCVNPDHLEPVTAAENIRRGIGVTAQNARKTHCKHGHEFTPENTYERHRAGRIERHCRKCKKATKERWVARHKFPTTPTSFPARW